MHDGYSAIYILMQQKGDKSGSSKEEIVKDNHTYRNQLSNERDIKAQYRRRERDRVRSTQQPKQHQEIQAKGLLYLTMES